MTLFIISQRTTHVSLLKYTLQATRDGSCLIKPDKASLKMRLGETHHVGWRAAQFSWELCAVREGQSMGPQGNEAKITAAIKLLV